MSTVKVQHKDGSITHYIDCRYSEKGDKFIIIHDEPDAQFGGLMPQVQHIYDKSELISITQEEET